MSCWRYLAKWGFTAQKPLRRAYEQNSAAVRQRLEVQQYPSIRRQAKAEKAGIHWGDEMGMRRGHQVGARNGRKGKTPTIPGTGTRSGRNMISTVRSYLRSTQKQRHIVQRDFRHEDVRYAAI